VGIKKLLEIANSLGLQAIADRLSFYKKGSNSGINRPDRLFRQ
jgi:hypothetical protein